jgi:hypothetical protein
MGISKISDFLGSEKVQGAVMQAGMSFALSKFKYGGLISAAVTADKLAGMLSGAMSKSPGEIADWVAGKADSAVSSVLDQAAKAGQFASTLATTKAKDLISNALSGVDSLVGGASQSIAEVVGTVQRIDLDSAVDGLINDIRIPSMATLSRSVQNELKIASGEFIGQIDAAGNLIDQAQDLALSATNITGKIADAQSLAGSVVDKVGNIVNESNQVVGSVVNQVQSAATQVTDAAGNVVNKATGLFNDDEDTA